MSCRLNGMQALRETQLYMIDESYGILCEARMEGQIVTVPVGELEEAKGKSNRQLIDDYCYWFHNWC